MLPSEGREGGEREEWKRRWGKGERRGVEREGEYEGETWEKERGCGRQFRRGEGGEVGGGEGGEVGGGEGENRMKRERKVGSQLWKCSDPCSQCSVTGHAHHCTGHRPQQSQGTQHSLHA